MLSDCVLSYPLTICGGKQILLGMPPPASGPTMPPPPPAAAPEGPSPLNRRERRSRFDQKIAGPPPVQNNFTNIPPENDYGRFFTAPLPHTNVPSPKGKFGSDRRCFHLT